MHLHVIGRSMLAFLGVLALGLALPVPTAARPATSRTEARVQSLIRQLRDPNAAVRFDAVGELSTLGRVARAAVPALAERLADEDANVRTWSARVLGALGPAARAAVPALAARLESTDETLREVVALALGSIGDGAVIPSLALRLQDDNRRVREAAGQALVLLGTPPVEASSVLAAQLGENMWAPLLLRRLGEAAVPALEARLHQHPPDRIRQQIMELLALIERLQRARPQLVPPMEALAELIAALDDDSRRQYAITRLGRAGRGPAAAEAVTALLTRFLDRNDRPRVVSALAQLGEDALPHLVEALRRDELRYELTWVFVKFGDKAVPPLAHALDDRDLRLPAALALGTLARYRPDRSPDRPYAAAATPRLRAAAATLVPELVKELREQRAASASQDALVTIGAAAVPALIGMLEDEKAGGFAAGTLSAMGPPAAAAAPVLALDLNHPDKDRRLTAAYALARIGPAAIPALRVALEDPRTRALAAVGLALGPSPPADIVPVLFEAAKNADIGWKAVEALLNLDGTATSFLADAVASGSEHAVRLLARMASWQKSMVASNASWGTPAEEAAARRTMDALRDAALPALTRAMSDTRTRTAAAWALAEFGSAALPALTSSLQDPDPAFRAAVARSLGSVPGAPPVLERALGDPDRRVREAAAYSLARRGQAGAKPILAALEDADPQTCGALVTALGNALEKANAPQQAVLEVIGKLTTKECRESAVRTLARLGPIAVPHLLRVMNGDDAVQAWSAVHAMVLLGPRASSGVPRLREALRDERTRAKAAEVLAAIGSEACEAADALGEALEDRTARWKAALALGRMGRCAVPPVMAALSRANSREAAAVALGRIGEPAQPAVPALEQLLSSPDENVRAAAGFALNKLRTPR